MDMPSGKEFADFVQWGFYSFGGIIAMMFYNEMKKMRKSVTGLNDTMILVVERQTVQNERIEDHHHRITTLEQPKRKR